MHNSRITVNGLAAKTVAFYARETDKGCSNQAGYTVRSTDINETVANINGTRNGRQLLSNLKHGVLELEALEVNESLGS